LVYNSYNPRVINGGYLLMIDIGNRIREIRTSKKITVSKLAQEVGVAQSFISSIEGGSKKCSLENLDKICHVLGITLYDFFAPSGETMLSPDPWTILNAAQQSPEIRRIMNKVQKLPPDKIKILEPPGKDEIGLYKVAETSEDIDFRSTLMSAHLEDTESIPLKTELEDTIKDVIHESRHNKEKKTSDKINKKTTIK